MPSITINVPSSGGSISVPSTASGSYQVTPGVTPVLSYQTNAGNMRPITNFGSGSWSADLTTMQCPIVGVSYLLTVYVGEPGMPPQPPQMATASRAFTRSS